MNVWEIRGKTLEFIEVGHIYIYDGLILPSITEMIQMKFPKKYDGIPRATLERASQLGTAVHEAIELFEKEGKESPLVEVRNWKFLKKAYGFSCVQNEVPVVLFDEERPIACGRLDLVLEEDGRLGLGDIKRTSSLDKEYLAYQLNLYRIAFQQCYQKDIEFLRGIHLRENVRKYVEIPINEEFIKDFIKEWREKNGRERNNYHSGEIY